LAFGFKIGVNINMTSLYYLSSLWLLDQILQTWLN